jgi:hypothetical protein
MGVLIAAGTDNMGEPSDHYLPNLPVILRTIVSRHYEFGEPCQQKGSRRLTQTNESPE